MKHLTITVLFFIFNSCNETKDNEIESILLDCLTKSYQEQQVDIRKELDELEKYLIESESLKSSSGQSFYDFYKEIEQLNDVPTTVDSKMFENIFKLTPNEFYAVECLGRLKDVDSTSLVKSKYYQMTITMQEAESNQATLSKTANVITSILSPSDFEHPYYRAIALLSIAYTSNTDKGLVFNSKNQTNENISESEIISFVMTDQSQIILEGKIIGLEELYGSLFEFIKVNTSNHLILMQTDEMVSYDLYVKVQEQIKDVYNDLRNSIAIEKFNKPYDKLTESDQEVIRSIYPSRIKEQVE